MVLTFDRRSTTKEMEHFSHPLGNKIDCPNKAFNFIPIITCLLCVIFFTGNAFSDVFGALLFSGCYDVYVVDSSYRQRILFVSGRPIVGKVLILSPYLSDFSA